VAAISMKANKGYEKCTHRVGMPHAATWSGASNLKIVAFLEDAF